MIRVILPTHLWRLANVEREIEIEIEDVATIDSVLSALEAQYPMLRGTIRDHVTNERRAYVRFFACGEDLSHEESESPLPEVVATGAEPLRVVGAIAGG